MSADTILLTRGIHYTINYRHGIITFLKTLRDVVSFPAEITVRYDVFPFSFEDEYSGFEYKTGVDTATGDTLNIAVSNESIFENIFGDTDLERSGSIFRGFTFGSNRDVSLNSGFRLQMNGKLSEEIDITAALTDEDIPLQPEGNTTKLQEFDKVFIELRSKSITGTLGDIEVNFNRGELLNYNRKIQGVKAIGEFGLSEIFLSGAISRGRYNTNSFNGIDGIQGPYKLTGADNEVNIIVLSGTEKVYVDGILQTRGDNADYVIDYAIGEITFMPNRIITRTSRIIVEFEYSDRRYSRTMLAGSYSFNALKNNLTVTASYLNEFDDKDKTIDFTLSDEDKQILENAGTNRNNAVKSGIVNAGVDPSTGIGRGLYIRYDSAAASGKITIYKFQPGTDSSIYQINFSFTGTGDYVKVSSLEYRFNGIGRGQYMPIVFLPVPTSYQSGNLLLNYSPDKNRYLNLEIEGSYSKLNGNQFSISNSLIEGGAFTGILSFNRSDFRFMNIPFREFSFFVKERFINRDYNSPERIGSVEFERNFNVQDSLKLTEELSEGGLKISPKKLISLNYNFAHLKRGEGFSAIRNIGEVNIFTDSLRTLEAVYRLENVNSDDDYTFSKGRWLKHFASLIYKMTSAPERPNILTGVFYNAETRRNIFTGSFDSLRTGSFAFKEITPFVTLANLYNFDLTSSFTYRDDEETSTGFLYKFSDSYIQKYSLTYSGISWLRLSAGAGILDKKLSVTAVNRGFTSSNNLILDSKILLDPLNSAIQADFLYNAAGEQTAKTERVFVFVGIGRGNYRYRGDLNNNGIQDENEFEPASFDGEYIRLNLPLDEFFPTVDLRTSARFIIKPSRYFTNVSKNFFGEALRNISFESLIKVEEKNKDNNPNDIYFLRTSNFLNDSNTLQGLQYIQQDLHFFENNNDYSLRLRFIQQRGFNQFSSGNERGMLIERSAKLRLGLTGDVSAEITFINKHDNNTAPLNSIRNRKIVSDNIVTDISYKPFRDIETGMVFSFARSQDLFPGIPTDADVNQQILRFIYSFSQSGRIKLELERDEVLTNKTLVILPYELTNGRVQGKSYFLRGIFDLNVTGNIQATINYNGRLEGRSKMIHTGTAQVTAFF